MTTSSTPTNNAIWYARGDGPWRPTYRAAQTASRTASAAAAAAEQTTEPTIRPTPTEAQRNNPQPPSRSA